MNDDHTSGLFGRRGRRIDWGTGKQCHTIPRELFDRFVKHVSPEDKATVLACMQSFSVLRSATLSSMFRSFHIKTTPQALSAIKHFQLDASVDPDVSLCTHVRELVVGRVSPVIQLTLDVGLGELLPLFKNARIVTVCGFFAHTVPVHSLPAIVNLTLRHVHFEQVSFQEWLALFPSLKYLHLYKVVSRHSYETSPVMIPVALSHVTMSSTNSISKIEGEADVRLYAGMVATLRNHPLPLEELQILGVTAEASSDVVAAVKTMAPTLKELTLAVAPCDEKADTALMAVKGLGCANRVVYIDAERIVHFSYM